jgi:hypothetical protein
MTWWYIHANTVFVPPLNTHKHICKDAVVSAYNKLRHHQLTELNEVIKRKFIGASRMQFIDHTVNLDYFFCAKRVQIIKHRLNICFCEI